MKVTIQLEFASDEDPTSTARSLRLLRGVAEDVKLRPDQAVVERLVRQIANSHDVDGNPSLVEAARFLAPFDPVSIAETFSAVLCGDGDSRLWSSMISLIQSPYLESDDDPTAPLTEQAMPLCSAAATATPKGVVIALALRERVLRDVTQAFGPLSLAQNGELGPDGIRASEALAALVRHGLFPLAHVVGTALVFLQHCQRAPAEMSPVALASAWLMVLSKLAEQDCLTPATIAEVDSILVESLATTLAALEIHPTLRYDIGYVCERLGWPRVTGVPATTRQLQSFQRMVHHKLPMSTVHYCPATTVLVTACSEQITTWEAETVVPAEDVRLNDRYACALDSSPSGQTLVVAAGPCRRSVSPAVVLYSYRGRHGNGNTWSENGGAVREGATIVSAARFLTSETFVTGETGSNGTQLFFHVTDRVGQNPVAARGSHRDIVTALVPLSQRVVLSCSRDRTAYIVDSRTAGIEATLRLGAAATCADVQQQANLVAIGEVDQKVSLYDLRAQNGPLAVLPLDSAPVSVSLANNASLGLGTMCAMGTQTGLHFATNVQNGVSGPPPRVEASGRHQHASVAWGTEGLRSQRLFAAGADGVLDIFTLVNDKL